MDCFASDEEIAKARSLEYGLLQSQVEYAWDFPTKRAQAGDNMKRDELLLRFADLRTANGGIESLVSEQSPGTVLERLEGCPLLLVTGISALPTIRCVLYSIAAIDRPIQ